jgi:hypothetical protein
VFTAKSHREPLTFPVIRAAEKINCPACLSFGPSSALKKDFYTMSMCTFFKTVDEPKSGATWTIYFFRSPNLIVLNIVVPIENYSKIKGKTLGGLAAPQTPSL